MIPIVKNNNKLRWKFENVKDLTEDGMYSEKLSTNGIDWIINICTYMDDDGGKWLDVLVLYESDNKKDKNWICEVDAKYKMLNRSGDGTDLIVERMACFSHEDDNGWGPCDFIKWDEFITNDNGYLKDDSIVIEIEFDFKYYDFSKKMPNFTDTTISVEETDFHLNKGVLCSKSTYFYDLFVNKKSQDTVIKLDDIEAVDFCHLLKSFDPSFDGIFEDNYEKLIKVAQKFGVSSLHHFIEQFLIFEHEMEAIDRFKIAEENGYEKLMKSCLRVLITGADIKLLHSNEKFEELKDTTKLRIMRRFLDIY